MQSWGGTTPSRAAPALDECPVETGAVRADEKRMNLLTTTDRVDPRALVFLPCLDCRRAVRLADVEAGAALLCPVCADRLRRYPSSSTQSAAPISPTASTR